MASSARGTSQLNNWIDVNSNTNLLGTTVYQRTADGEIKRTLADLQDQLKMLRNDVEKKDRLIGELSSVKEIEKIRNVEAVKYDAIFSVERSAADHAKKELSSIQTRYESMAIELGEYKVKVQARDERINEMKRDMESLKSENSTMNSLIVALRNKIKELEGDLGGFETVASKSEITISTLQRDKSELQQAVLDLESRIRTHMMEREESERYRDMLNNKLTDLAGQITRITGVKINANPAGLDTIIAKINDLVNENSMVKGRLVTTSDSLSHNESENKANRETIQRLVNEINKFEKDAANLKLSSDHIKAERDAAISTKAVLEKEIDTLKERLANIQTAWQASKSELEKRESMTNAQSANLKQMEYDLLFNKNCLGAFKDQVASLLSDGFVKVDANEDQIKEKIKLLMTSSKDRGLMIASMEGKVQQLANQLQDQINLYKELEGKYQRSEVHIIELENKLKSLDNEYCANEVLRDNLKSDRVKYLSFLERIGKVLKISEISADVGLDMNVDIILARADQLVKSENESLQDKQTNIYNLQRKVKALKEQLDNKELHLDLLRKKLGALEEERAGKCALEREVDDHILMSKKFKVKVEKLTEQLNKLKTENSDLRAQLLDLGVAKTRTNEQDKEIQKLLDRLGELEAIKEKQQIKLSKYREEMESANEEASKTRNSSDSTVQALSQELRHMKQDLEKTESREKQLLDFRNVVSRMIGLEINALAVADYEIIARLERIISAFNGGIMPVHVQQMGRIQTPPNVTSSGTTQNYELSSSSSGSSSPTRRHHQHNHNHHTYTNQASVRDRSPSPHRHHHHHRHNNHTHYYHDAETSGRTRSKSPRKVTIDPNSY